MYVSLAAVCFAIGAVGVVVPGLPTTPFLLLTSYFLTRSWPALNRRLLRSQVFGPLLRDWHEHRAVRRGVKYTALVMVAAAVAFAVLLGNLSPVALTGTLSAACVGLVVVWRLPVRG